MEIESKREHYYKEFVWALRSGAIPAGRIISNAGAREHKPATSTINCTVSGTVGATRLQRMAERLNDLAHEELAAEAEFYSAALLTEADQVILTLLREKERS